MHCANLVGGIIGAVRSAPQDDVAAGVAVSFHDGSDAILGNARLVSAATIGVYNYLSSKIAGPGGKWRTGDLQ